MSSVPEEFEDQAKLSEYEEAVKIAAGLAWCAETGPTNRQTIVRLRFRRDTGIVLIGKNLLRLRRVQQLKEIGHLLANRVIVQAGGVGLNLRMAGIVREWLLDNAQAEGTNVPDASAGNPRTRCRSDQRQQFVSTGNSLPRDRHPSFPSVFPQLEIAARHTGTRRLPFSAPGDVPEDDLIVIHDRGLRHRNAPPLGSEMFIEER